MRRVSSGRRLKIVALLGPLVGAVGLVVLGGSQSGAMAASAEARGYVPPANCHAVKFVGVRGSGDGSSTLGVIASAINAALAKRAKEAGVDYAGYGVPYAAVGIDWWKLTNVELPQYRLSEREGRNNLRTLIRKQVRDCPREQLVVEGYSQGAQAVGDVFSEGVGGLTTEELAHVKAVALIADPGFNSREPFDKGSYRMGRNGVLGARTPGELSSVANRIRAWCRKDDIVCQGPGATANHGQDRYLADFKEAIVSFLANKMGMGPARGAPDVVTTQGVGDLLLGVATESRIAGSAGTPDYRIDGQGLPSLPPYRALGYGCKRTGDVRHRDPLWSLKSNSASGEYCSTIYYLNRRSGRFVAFWTSSNGFITIRGTRPGAAQAEADHREGAVASGAADPAITERDTHGTLLLQNRGGHLVIQGPNQPYRYVGGTVNSFELESRTGSVGFLLA
jgi:hypothetical protein